MKRIIGYVILSLFFLAPIILILVQYGLKELLMAVGCGFLAGIIYVTGIYLIKK